MKTTFCLLLALTFSFIVQAQPNNFGVPAGEANHGQMTKPEVPKSTLNKNEVGWELLQKYDLKKKKADKKLVDRIKKPVMLTGFAIPLEFDKKQVNEFLLVPYVPSCMHVPPPPENQIVYVKLKKSEVVDNLYYPLQVTGLLSIDESKSKEALYNFSATELKVIKE